MYLDSKRVFLAGSTGLAGTGILKHIVESYPTTTVQASCHRSTGRSFLKHERVQYVRGDLRSLEDCRRMVQGCDCAIMAAAYTGGAGLVTAFPWEHVRENITMNMQMLEAFRLEGVKRIVYIGSATLYQEFNGHIREDQLDLNRDPAGAYYGFGWVVRFIERACTFLHEQYGLQAIIARVANIFGPYAKFDPKTSNFIPAIIRKAADRIDPFEVWGSPDVTRDVIYVDDFARAIVMMADNDAVGCDVFNVGSGVKTTVGDVVTWALRHAGHTPSEIKYLQDKPMTMQFRALDCSKARRLLGWEPQCSIEEGIRETVEWWNKNKEWWRK